MKLLIGCCSLQQHSRNHHIGGIHHELRSRTWRIGAEMKQDFKGFNALSAAKGHSGGKGTRFDMRAVRGAAIVLYFQMKQR